VWNIFSLTTLRRQSLHTLELASGVLSAVNLSLPFSLGATFSAATGVCDGALHTLELTVLHDGLGTLTAVHAALVLTSVTSRYTSRLSPSPLASFPHLSPDGKRVGPAEVIRG
jgi:hypothetical protein